MYKYIPNTVTLLASFFGVLATAFAFQNNLEYAAYSILLAALCDFADGFLARLLNAKSKLGADLDSLSDVVSFGVAPSAIAYQLLNAMLPNDLTVLSYLAFLIVPFSVLRLAIFNNSTNQTTSFVGLPVPAHAMLWVGLVFLKDNNWEWIQHLYNPFFLLFFVVIFSLLLVSKLQLFSLKENPLKNKFLWVFLLLTLLFLFFFHLGGLFFVVLLYVSSGIVSLFRR